MGEKGMEGVPRQQPVNVMGLLRGWPLLSKDVPITFTRGRVGGKDDQGHDRLDEAVGSRYKNFIFYHFCAWVFPAQVSKYYCTTVQSYNFSKGFPEGQF